MVIKMRKSNLILISTSLFSLLFLAGCNKNEDNLIRPNDLVKMGYNKNFSYDAKDFYSKKDNFRKCYFINSTPRLNKGRFVLLGFVDKVCDEISGKEYNQNKLNFENKNK